MSEFTLSGLLSCRNKDDVAVITPSERLSVGDLLQRARDFRQSHQPDGQPNIVRSSNVVEFAVGLVALDGFVGAFACEPRGDEIAAECMTAVDGRPPEAGNPTRWVLATSGTTGEPKAVVHSLETLASTTKRDPSEGSEFRWGLLYDPARFAGLQVLLQAMIGGGVLVVPPEADLRAAVDFMVAERVTALSATPSQWRNILMAPGSEALPLRQVTLGGEIADQSVLDGLSKTFAEARVVHIYASTEAGVGFTVKDGLAGFPLTYLDAGTLDGVDLMIGANDNLMLRKRKPAKFLFDHHRPMMTEDGYLDTGDRVQIREDRVMFLGRSSGAINVGGNKVMPEEIEGLLLEHSAVVAARVYAKPSSLLGNLVAADVQLNPDEESASVVRDELLGLCRSRLQHWQIPAELRVVRDLELSETGKVDRKAKSDG
jgi:acyl-CoA synthetase (AMP-forming)/AMP-acid ligase II